MFFHSRNDKNYVGVLKLNYQESKQGADIKASNFLMKTYL